MQTSKPRSGSSEMAQKTSVSSSNSKQSPSKSTKGTNFSSDSSEGKPSKVFDRKPSTKSSSLPEKRIARAPEMQQQLGRLQEELKKAKEERSRALEELEEFRNKKKMPTISKEGVEILEREVEKAKESERKMLESLILQTKQLEQTKISLEEAKLEIMTLQEGIKSLEVFSYSQSGKNQENRQSPLDLVRAQAEIGVIKNELKLATEAEEKSKKAMDGLALALKEVTTEVNQVKARLSMTQSELENSRSEAEKAESLLKVTDEKLRAAVEESQRLKLESEESIAVWNEKENGFINCMKTCEEEITELKLENGKLTDSLRAAREDNSKLRDILKQAVNEATVVKEALEIARNENSKLKDLLSEKENALQSILQEYECLKVSEAAALDSVKELKGFLAATSTLDSSSKTSVNDVKESNKMAKLPSDQWRGETRIQNGWRHSVGGSGKFKGSIFDTDGPSMERKGQIFGSISNASDLRVPSSLFTDDRETLNSDDFNRIDGTQLNGMGYERGSPTKQRKKKPILKRFGDMLRRRSFHK